MRPVIARTRSQEGMTLVEVLVGGMLTVLALGAVMFFVEASFTQTRSVEDRVAGLDDATRAFERMVREVRTAAVVTPEGPRRLRVRRWVGENTASMRDIRYDCSQPAAGELPGARTCTRTDLTAGGGPVQVVTGVVNEDVFTAREVVAPASNPPIELSLSLRVPDRANPIVLRGLATSRNCRDDGVLGTCET